MSLRVLLADESASIHKVFQMGLQDFGAEVKSVHSGLDVVEVAESYDPHIIFVDILLQKKNGYEVTSELNKHSSLSLVPVVLMWSSFMELDRKQFTHCGAKGQLEKPFDVEAMREIIKSLVESTQSQHISSFLNFPSSISKDFVDEENKKGNSGHYTETVPASNARPQQSSPPPPQVNSMGHALFVDPGSESSADLSLEDEDSGEQPEIEASSVFNTQAGSDEFDMYEVTPTGAPRGNNNQAKPTTEEPEKNRDEASWEAKPLSPSNMEQTKTDESDMDQFESMDLGKERKMDLSDFLYKPEAPARSPEPTRTDQQIQNVRVPVYQDDTVANVDVVTPAEKEAIIRSEVRAWLMTAMRQELPEMLEKIVRQELNSILEQEMALKGSSPQT